MCCRCSSSFLINNPRHGREKKTSSSLFFSLSLVLCRVERKEKDERQWNGFLLFLFLSADWLCWEIEDRPLSLSYVYSRPLYIYTNIKRYRTQTVDFPTPSFPYSSQTVWGFVIFPSDCININIFSIYFMDGIFSIFFIIFYFSTSFILMDSQPSVVVIIPPFPSSE